MKISEQNNSNFTKKYVLTICLSIVALVLCFFRNRILPDIAIVRTIGTVATVVIIVVALYMIVTSVSHFMTAKEFGNGASVSRATQPMKSWSPKKLFDYLYQEDIIDVIIDNNGVELKVGTTSDSRSVGGRRFKDIEFFDKCYYINDTEYSDFDRFKEDFIGLLHSDTIKIKYVGIGDMVVHPE